MSYGPEPKCDQTPKQGGYGQPDYGAGVRMVLDVVIREIESACAKHGDSNGWRSCRCYEIIQIIEAIKKRAR